MKRCLFFLLWIPVMALAQKAPTIEEKTKDLQKETGFITFYRDEENGKIWWEIQSLDKEILYVSSLPAGLGSNDVGLDRGMLGGDKVVKFVREGKKIFLVQPNYSYRALSNIATERRAVEESFAQSVLWAFPIEAATNGAFLVDATDFLLRDALQISARLRSSQQGNYQFDKNRSALYHPRTKNFPLNSEFEITATFGNSDGNSGNFVRQVTPSAEAITLRIHHSFVQLPDEGYQPRLFDARSGFIPTSFYDYASPISSPIETKYIIRHRLQKKNPAAATSEAVKPIVYYLDNGTPEPIRSALLEGARWWNQAFEAAGFINAFRVEILPDDADPMDVRYNVINWVHRSTRGWSYGASVVDPRTGEIIKGNVTLGSLRVRQDYLIAVGLLSPYENGIPADDKMAKMALDRLKQLSAHEVGHTIGLMHNYAASVSNRASVMDYPHPLIQLDAAGNIDFRQAYDDKIGEWDKVAINFGYREFSSPAEEKKGLAAIMSEATAKGLQFIADQDARAAGGLHPQAHLWDNGSDAVEELKNVMKVRAKALTQFGEKSILPGQPMALLEDVLVPVYFYHRYQAEAVTKLIGGMDYRYALRGDGQLITAPLSKQVQLNALNAIIDCLNPEFLVIPERIIQLIPPRPAGYGGSRELFRKRTGLAFDALSPAETAADFPLSFLFHPQRLNRMVQYEVQQKGLGVKEMVATLINKTWKAQAATGIARLIQLQTQQVVLTYLLAGLINNENSYTVKATLQKAVDDLKSFIATQSKTTQDETYKAHLLLAAERIKKPEEAKATTHREIPPGAPIGCEDLFY